MNIKDIVAIMAVRVNPDDEVGKLDITNSDHDGVYLKEVGKTEAQFYSESDFAEPSRENFESAIRALLDGKADLGEGVKIHYLTEYKIGAQH